jgi:hypothetical protein
MIRRWCWAGEAHGVSPWKPASPMFQESHGDTPWASFQTGYQLYKHIAHTLRALGRAGEGIIVNIVVVDTGASTSPLSRKRLEGGSWDGGPRK